MQRLTFHMIRDLIKAYYTGFVVLWKLILRRILVLISDEPEERAVLALKGQLICTGFSICVMPTTFRSGYAVQLPGCRPAIARSSWEESPSLVRKRRGRSHSNTAAQIDPERCFRRTVSHAGLHQMGTTSHSPVHSTVSPNRISIAKQSLIANSAHELYPVFCLWGATSPPTLPFHIYHIIAFYKFHVLYLGIIQQFFILLTSLCSRAPLSHFVYWWVSWMTDMQFSHHLRIYQNIGLFGRLQKIAKRV